MCMNVHVCGCGCLVRVVPIENVLKWYPVYEKSCQTDTISKLRMLFRFTTKVGVKCLL